MFYNLRRGPDFEACQWNKNGDHPDDYVDEVEGLEQGNLRTWTGEEAKNLGWEGQVVRYFRHPDPKFSGDTICPSCGKTFHDHGWIEEEKLYVIPSNELVPQLTFETNPVPKGAVCPSDYIATFYVFANDCMEGSKPKTEKRYKIMDQKIFEMLYAPIDTL